MAEPDAVRRQEHRRGRCLGDRRRRGCGQVQRLLQPLDPGLAGPGPGGDIGRDGVEIRQHVAAQVARQRLWPRRPGERRHPARPQRAGRRAVDHRPALAQYLEQDERQARAGQAFAEDRRHVGPRRENVGRKFVVGKDAEAVVPGRLDRGLAAGGDHQGQRDPRLIGQGREEGQGVRLVQHPFGQEQHHPDGTAAGPHWVGGERQRGAERDADGRLQLAQVDHAHVAHQGVGQPVRDADPVLPPCEAVHGIDPKVRRGRQLAEPRQPPRVDLPGAEEDDARDLCRVHRGEQRRGLVARGPLRAGREGRAVDHCIVAPTAQLRGEEDTRLQRRLAVLSGLDQDHAATSPAGESAAAILARKASGVSVAIAACAARTRRA